MQSMLGVRNAPRDYSIGRNLFDTSPRNWLLAGAQFDAIIANNDEMAIGVMKAARDKGLDVPGDLSIVGFDDLPMASRVWPNLTTVRLPIRDMGRMAAEKLTAGLRGLDPAALTQPEVDPSLVVRDSARAL